MRKLILFNMVTLDGYFEGQNGDIDWHHTDEEFNQFSEEQINGVGAIIFGRVTYEMMASYWPTPIALQNDPMITEKMNSFPKIVFSRTLEQANWNNTRLIKDGSEITALKQEAGKDLIIFGSANLASSLIDHIDEYRIIVNPVTLGAGRPLFQDALKLKLFNTRVFNNGNVLLYYQRG